MLKFFKKLFEAYYSAGGKNYVISRDEYKRVILQAKIYIRHGKDPHISKYRAYLKKKIYSNAFFIKKISDGNFDLVTSMVVLSIKLFDNNTKHGYKSIW